MNRGAKKIPPRILLIMIIFMLSLSFHYISYAEKQHENIMELLTKQYENSVSALRLYFKGIEKKFNNDSFFVKTDSETGNISSSIRLFNSQCTVYYESEENNNIAQANDVSGNYYGLVDYCIHGDITDVYTDEDWFKFNVTMAGEFSILGKWNGIHKGKGWEDDLVITLIRADGTPIATSSDDGSGEDMRQKLEQHVPVGIYYIVVKQTIDYEYLYVGEDYLIEVSYESDDCVVYTPTQPYRNNWPYKSNRLYIDESYVIDTGGSSCSKGHGVEYRFNWGDGTFSDWGPHPNAPKEWSSAGVYEVTAQARCTDNSTSSQPSPVSRITVSSIKPLMPISFDYSYTLNSRINTRFNLVPVEMSVNKIKDEDGDLVEDVHYEISGNEITINYSYYEDKDLGILTLTFDIEGGADQVVEMEVKAGNAHIPNPELVTYLGSQEKGEITVKLNGRKLISLEDKYGYLALGEDYTLNSFTNDDGVKFTTVSFSTFYMHKYSVDERFILFKMDGGLSPAITLSSRPGNATLSRQKANYLMGSRENIVVTLTPNGQIPTWLNDDKGDLVEGRDYTVSDNVYTILSAYLEYRGKDLDQDASLKVTLTYEMSGGVNPSLEITIYTDPDDIDDPTEPDPTVPDEDPDNAIVRPTVTAHVINSGQNLSFTLTPNGRQLVKILKGNSSLEKDTHYTVADNTINILPSYLDGIEEDEINLTFVMDGGDNPKSMIRIFFAGTTYQSISNLKIGERVLDDSWRWDHKTGLNYSGTGLSRPVSWLVVGKDHYEGLHSHVTLLSRELVARHAFDNSTNRGFNHGSNNWTNSGTPDATYGLRPFLNSLLKIGTPSYFYNGDGFYNAFSLPFKDAVLETILPNKLWNNGVEYYTSDRVFTLSQTELGGGSTLSYQIGSVLPYFDINNNNGPADETALNQRRLARLGVTSYSWWTRSPGTSSSSSLCYINSGGGIGLTYYADTGEYGVRPAVNIDSEIPVALKPNNNGVYEIIWSATVEPTTATYTKGSRSSLDITLTLNGRTLNNIYDEFGSLTIDEDYTISDGVYTILWEYLDGKDVGTFDLNFGMEAGKNPAVTITIEPGNATVFPRNITYIMGSGDDLNIDLSLNGRTLESISDGENYLTEDVDYILFAGNYIIYNTYIDSKGVGETTLVFNMSGGNNPEVAINIEPGNATVSPSMVNRKLGTGEVKISFVANGRKLENINYSILRSGGQFKGEEGMLTERIQYNYNIAEGTYTIIPSFLSNLGVCEITLTFDMDGGENPTVVIVISPEGNTQPLISLDIGDRVVDKSWTWEHKTGKNYTGNGIKKPITWIVVGKNHYDSSGAHVTLMSEELIARHIFDDSTNRGFEDNGSNHWGNSGMANANHGLRSFLNQSFFGALPNNFKEVLYNTKLNNVAWESGSSYTTTDAVFIPSATELGAQGDDYYKIGRIWPYYDRKHYAGPEDNELNVRRLAQMPGICDSGNPEECLRPYWTRSPYSTFADLLYSTNSAGGLGSLFSANKDGIFVRVAINLNSDTPISLVPGSEGVFELLINGDGNDQKFGDINGDNIINVTDAILLLRHLVGLTDLSDTEEYDEGALDRARVSGEESLTVVDAILILRYVVGIINKFPAEGL